MSVCQLWPASARPIGLPFSTMFDRIITSGTPGSWYMFATLISSSPQRALKSLSCSAESSWRELEINRSEEHTSELQSRENLVCRLLLEKKKQTNRYNARGGTGAPIDPLLGRMFRGGATDKAKGGRVFLLLRWYSQAAASGGNKIYTHFI